jgi:hypothetical protein
MERNERLHAADGELLGLDRPRSPSHRAGPGPLRGRGPRREVDKRLGAPTVHVDASTEPPASLDHPLPPARPAVVGEVFVAGPVPMEAPAAAVFHLAIIRLSSGKR